MGVIGFGNRGVVIAEARKATFVVAGLSPDRVGGVVVAGNCSGAVILPKDVAIGVGGVTAAGPGHIDQLAVTSEEPELPPAAAGTGGGTGVSEKVCGVIAAGTDAVVVAGQQAAAASICAVRGSRAARGVVANVLGDVEIEASGAGSHGAGVGESVGTRSQGVVAVATLGGGVAPAP